MKEMMRVAGWSVASRLVGLNMWWLTLLVSGCVSPLSAFQDPELTSPYDYFRSVPNAGTAGTINRVPMLNVHGARAGLSFPNIYDKATKRLHSSVSLVQREAGRLSWMLRLKPES